MIAIGWVMLQLRFYSSLYVVVIAGVFTLISGVVYVDRWRAPTAGGRPCAPAAGLK